MYEELRQTVRKHMDELQYKLILYRTGTKHVTSTVYDSALQENNRQTDPKTRLYFFFCWSLLIKLFKIKNVQSFKHYKRTEFQFFKNPNSVLFTCTITCTDGITSITYSTAWISIPSRAMKTQFMVIVSITSALNQVTVLRFIRVLQRLCREQSRYTHYNRCIKKLRLCFVYS